MWLPIFSRNLYWILGLNHQGWRHWMLFHCPAPRFHSTFFSFSLPWCWLSTNYYLCGDLAFQVLLCHPAVFIMGQIFPASFSFAFVIFLIKFKPKRANVLTVSSHGFEKNQQVALESYSIVLSYKLLYKCQNTRWILLSFRVFFAGGGF